ncbi:hypothetical protein KYR89_004387 [Salmonella enterica]|nr:hypothetical protein [Salmonella enterica]
MEYTKKQYLLIGVAFILVAIFGFMLEMTVIGNDVLRTQELVSVLWKIFAVVGGIIFFIGVLKKADDKKL